jgi:hypothetical protein
VQQEQLATLAQRERLATPVQQERLATLAQRARPEEIQIRRAPLVPPEEIQIRRARLVRPEEIQIRRARLVRPEEIQIQRARLVRPEEIQIRKVRLVRPEEIRIRRVRPARVVGLIQMTQAIHAIHVGAANATRTTCVRTRCSANGTTSSFMGWAELVVPLLLTANPRGLRTSIAPWRPTSIGSRVDAVSVGLRRPIKVAACGTSRTARTVTMLAASTRTAGSTNTTRCPAITIDVS